MRAMLLDAPRTPLRAADVPTPRPAPGQLLLRVHACAVCRTDLHVVDGELPPAKSPVIPGHQIVGSVVEVGGDGGSAGATATTGSSLAMAGAGSGPTRKRWKVGDRVGVPWLGSTCGTCRFCAGGRENLCDEPRFTGYQLDGGFAEFCAADARFCFSIPDGYGDLEAAPLLCAGLIGYRSLVMAGDARRLGLYGFGAAAHILLQVARHQGRRVFAFTRAGDDAGQAFARSLGAEWAGASDVRPPEELDAAIVLAPVGALVPAALRSVAKGGVVVCGGIHMSEIPAFPYELLWGERVLRSVANLTRRDAEDFLALAPRIPVRTQVTPFALEAANEALDSLRRGKHQGAAVLVVDAELARGAR